MLIGFRRVRPHTPDNPMVSSNRAPMDAVLAASLCCRQAAVGVDLEPGDEMGEEEGARSLAQPRVWHQAAREQGIKYELTIKSVTGGEIKAPFCRRQERCAGSSMPAARKLDAAYAPLPVAWLPPAPRRLPLSPPPGLRSPLPTLSCSPAGGAAPQPTRRRHRLAAAARFGKSRFVCVKRKDCQIFSRGKKVKHKFEKTFFLYFSIFFYCHKPGPTNFHSNQG